jgi:hypothetical protein
LELDEITQRLKKKLHVVTNEGFTAPLCLIRETGNSFRSEAASHTISNTKDSKSTETAALTSVNEEAYEADLALKITNLSPVAVGFLKLSIHTNETERSHVKVREQNYIAPVHFYQGCENVTSSIVFFIQLIPLHSIGMCSKLLPFLCVIYFFLPLFPTKLFFHPHSLHLAIYFLVDLLVLLIPNSYPVCSESRYSLKLWYVDLVVCIEVAVEVCCCFTVVKQWLKCNTGKVCNCLIQFLLTMVVSIEERVL